MRRPTWKQIRRALFVYYNAPLTEVFKRFRAGLIYFSVGMMIILMANQSLEPSLRQDLVTLAGLVMVIIGFFIAIMSHMRLIIGRIVQFINKK